MATKTLNSRIVHKHDIEENWKLAVNFKPLPGEVIVYDPDTNNPFSRVKVGDGKTFVNNLPFVYEPVTMEDIEEICGSMVTIATADSGVSY